MSKRKFEPYVLDVENVIRYATEQPAAVEDVIVSLQGMDRLVRYHVPKAVSKLAGARVLKAELLVYGIEEGSLVSDTIVRLVFGSKEEYEKFLDKVRDSVVITYKNGNPVMKGVIVSGVVTAIVLAALAYMNQDQPQSGALSNIKGDYNTVLVMTAEAYQTDPKAVADIAAKSIARNQQQTAGRAALQFAAPAKAEGAGIEIIGNGQAVAALSADAVKQLPELSKMADESFDQPYRKVRVMVRASDLDSERRGWAGTIEGITEQRVRLIFSRPGDAAAVAFRPEFEADVSVTYASPAKLKPILIIIDRVY